MGERNDATSKKKTLHSNVNLLLGVGPPVTVVVHGTGNLDVTRDVGTVDKGRKLSLSDIEVLLGGVEAVPEAALHDASQLLVDLLGGPADTLGVLGHLETGDGDTTAVGSLGWAVPDTVTLAGSAVSLIDIDGLLGGTHVGTLSNELAASGDEILGLLLGNLVLGSRWEGNVDLANVGPWAGTWDVGEAGLEGVLSIVELVEVLTVKLELGDESDILLSESLVGILCDERTLGVGQGDDLGLELDTLESSVLSNVTGTGDGDTLALEGFLSAGGVLDHVVNVVDETVTSGLWADERSTPASTLTGDDTLPGVAVRLVGTEEITDLASTNTDITSWDISEGTNVAGEFSHEGIAEATDLVVGLALRIEVGTTLSSTHRETSQGILEDLLETQELEDGKVDGRMEAETTLVWTESGVELDTVSTVDLELTLVVLPNNTELNDTLWDRDDWKGSAEFWLKFEELGGLERGLELIVGLVEFRLQL